MCKVLSGCFKLQPHVFELFWQNCLCIQHQDKCHFLCDYWHWFPETWGEGPRRPYTKVRTCFCEQTVQIYISSISMEKAGPKVYKFTVSSLHPSALQLPNENACLCTVCFQLGDVFCRQDTLKIPVSLQLASIPWVDFCASHTFPHQTLPFLPFIPHVTMTELLQHILFSF